MCKKGIQPCFLFKSFYFYSFLLKKKPYLPSKSGKILKLVCKKKKSTCACNSEPFSVDYKKEKKADRLQFAS